MTQFQQLVIHIRAAYSAIATKIDELVVVLNETELADSETKILANRIETFLEKVEQSVTIAERSARRGHAPSETIALLDRELNDLKRLEMFLQLAARKPTLDLITKIHRNFQLEK